MRMKVLISIAIGLGMVSSFLYEADVEEVQQPEVLAKEEKASQAVVEELISPDPARVLKQTKMPELAEAKKASIQLEDTLSNEDKKAIDVAFNLVEESLTIAEKSSAAASLVKFLDQKNMNPVQNLEGTEEFGERYEVAASSPSDASSRVEANFNIMQDGSEEMQSIRSFSLIQDEQAFEALFKKMNAKMAESPEAQLIEMTAETRRWLLPEGLAVWMKQTGEKDGKLELAVATEYLP